jgi:hypothetical protein
MKLPSPMRLYLMSILLIATALFCSNSSTFHLWVTIALASFTPVHQNMNLRVNYSQSNNLTTTYLPIIQNQSTDMTLPPQILSSSRTVNVPFFDVTNVTNDRFSEMAIFWLGKVTSIDNYTDVRVGYNHTSIFVRTSTFDRKLWFDLHPTASTLPNWDTISLVIDTNSDLGSQTSSTSFRLVAELNINAGTDNPSYRASYTGNGSGWTSASIAFHANPDWRGEGYNENSAEDRGWAMSFEIPFTSLGISSPPPDGTIWRLGVQVFDRDDAAGTQITPQIWPELMIDRNPSTWGRLHFGLPIYTPPGVPKTGSITIQNKLNDVMVIDAAVGGTTDNLCPGDTNFIWNIWGYLNFTGAPDFAIQNQADVADWPCFAKYYLTFPLDQIPNGKSIISATLSLHQFGGSDPTQAYPSLIQVFTIGQNWDESTITWNNAPLAFENVSQAWVNPTTFPGWPGIPYEWDVTRALAQAYQLSFPLRLAMYEADAAMHSGKYFSSSDAEDWNYQARPTLMVVWGEP